MRQFGSGGSAHGKPSRMSDQQTAVKNRHDWPDGRGSLSFCPHGFAQTAFTRLHIAGTGSCLGGSFPPQRLQASVSPLRGSLNVPHASQRSNGSLGGLHLPQNGLHTCIDVDIACSLHIDRFFHTTAIRVRAHVCAAGNCTNALLCAARVLKQAVFDTRAVKARAAVDCAALLALISLNPTRASLSEGLHLKREERKQ